MRRQCATSALAVIALVLGAGPTWAHEEITPSSFASGKPVFLALSAANEKHVDLVKIALTAPAGAPFGATTRQPDGWIAEHGGETITWSGGAVKPDTFQQWGFEVEGADQPGPLQFKVTLGFAGGETEESDVVVNALSPDATAATPTTAGAASTGASTSVGAAPNGAGESALFTSRGSGRADAALAVAIVASVLAAAALALAARRRSSAVDTTRLPRPEQDF